MTENKKVEVSICHINILSDFLQILKKEDYKALRENGFEGEYIHGNLQEWIDDILNNFCKPLIEYDKDTEIILSQDNEEEQTENYKVEIDTAYSPETDITFILKETIKDTDGETEYISTEIKGFYYGEPDEECTKEFYGKLKAEY